MMMEGSQPFNNNPGGMGQDGNPGMMNEEGMPVERKLPSEMKHRPKIPRTPNKTERGQHDSSMNSHQSQGNLNSMVLPTKNGKALNVSAQRALKLM
jgi:hypothetical protein